MVDETAAAAACVGFPFRIALNFFSRDNNEEEEEAVSSLQTPISRFVAVAIESSPEGCWCDSKRALSQLTLAFL